MIAIYDPNDLINPVYVFGGSIVSPKVIITCGLSITFFDFSYYKYKAVITDKSGERISKDIVAVEKRVNPDTSMSSDFGLAYLADPFIVTNRNVNTGVEQISLAEDPTLEYTSYLGLSLTLCGFHDTYLAANDFTNFIDESTCNIFIPRDPTYCSSVGYGVLANQNCATSTNLLKVSVCEFDVGSALYLYDATKGTFTLWGIATGNGNCSDGQEVYVIILKDDLAWVKARIAANP